MQFSIGLLLSSAVKSFDLSDIQEDCFAQVRQTREYATVLFSGGVGIFMKQAESLTDSLILFRALVTAVADEVGVILKTGRKSICERSRKALFSNSSNVRRNTAAPMKISTAK